MAYHLREMVHGCRSRGAGGMQTHELYKKYRQLIENLANKPSPREIWLKSLHSLQQQFEREATALQPGSASLLCEELSDQLEHEALRSTGKHRRDVLLAAVKGFDEMSTQKQ